MKIYRLIFVFILALLVGGVINIPASFVFKFVKHNDLQISGVHGRIWSARVDSVRFFSAGKTYNLENVYWRVNPFYLVLLKAKAHVSFNAYTGQGEGDVSVGLSKVLNLSNFNFSGDLQPLVKALSPAPASVSGALQLSVIKADLPLTQSPVWPSELEASVSVAKTKALSPFSFSLGNIQVDINQENKELLVADVNNRGGDLAIKGSASLAPNLSYKTDIILKPENTLPDNVKGLLGLAMPRNPNGEYVLKQKGELPR